MFIYIVEFFKNLVKFYLTYFWNIYYFLEWFHFSEEMLEYKHRSIFISNFWLTIDDDHTMTEDVNYVFNEQDWEYETI